MYPRRGVLAVLALGVVALLAVLVSPEAAASSLRRTVGSPWFPLLLFGLYLLRPFVAWPITLLSALVGFRYGVAVGFPIALAGTVLTSLPPFFAARWWGPGESFLGWLTTGSDRYFTEVGDLRGLIAARLAPTPAEATSAAAGVAGVSLPAFVLGTLVGELPWTIAAVLAGSALTQFDPSGVTVDPRLVLAGTAVAVLLLAGPTYRYFASRSVDR